MTLLIVYSHVDDRLGNYDDRWATWLTKATIINEDQ